MPFADTWERMTKFVDHGATKLSIVMYSIAFAIEFGGGKGISLRASRFQNGQRVQGRVKNRFNAERRATGRVICWNNTSDQGSVAVSRERTKCPKGYHHKVSESDIKWKKLRRSPCL